MEATCPDALQGPVPNTGIIMTKKVNSNPPARDIWNLREFRKRPIFSTRIRIRIAIVADTMPILSDYSVAMSLLITCIGMSLRKQAALEVRNQHESRGESKKEGPESRRRITFGEF